MSYAWDYMIKTEPRGKRLYEIIQPLITECRSVVEMNCGFAPLYPYLKDLDYTGFDNNPDCIAALKRTYPLGKWLVCDDRDFPTAQYDLVLLLGAVGGKHPLDSMTQDETFKRLADLAKLGIVEHSKKIKVKLPVIGRYDAEFNNHHRNREVNIYVRQCNN